MAIAAEILRTYRAPRAALRRQLSGRPREDRALIYLFVACLLIFVSHLPQLAQTAPAGAGVPLSQEIAGAFVGWLFIAPFLFYAIAGLSHLIAGLFGGCGSWYSARMALFWALLAVAPVWLFYGLVAGLFGAGAAQTGAGLLVAGCFVYIWGAGLRESESAAMWDMEQE